MKDLKKLAIILRALGFKVEEENETVSFGDGAVLSNRFLSITTNTENKPVKASRVPLEPSL